MEMKLRGKKERQQLKEAPSRDEIEDFKPSVIREVDQAGIMDRSFTTSKNVCESSVKPYCSKDILRYSPFPTSPACLLSLRDIGINKRTINSSNTSSKEFPKLKITFDLR
ncbi:hypothetical protein CTA1_669 [Colletotrichum tanaceti]|uniref:Uncharacterized protein n=1 Tax=Colletotrichum tanaceti TaxID=1306861 RepID=A0A4U6X0D0_9PEZI|nr:hypothetical protein CTA1_669 [Colletotrichum tanaceti]